MDLMESRRRLMTVMAGGLLKKVGTHTLQSDYSSGNGTGLIPIIMDDNMISADAIVYVLVFNGNTFISSYKVDCIVFGSTASTAADLASTLSNTPGYCFRNNYAQLSNGVAATLRASAGTVVDVYRMDH